MTDALPELEVLRAALAAAEARADAMAAQAARAQAAASGSEAVIVTLEIEIEKLRRALYGQRVPAPRAAPRPVGAATRGTGGRDE